MRRVAYTFERNCNFLFSIVSRMMFVFSLFEFGNDDSVFFLTVMF